jgi:hypothetical protein
MLKGGNGIAAARGVRTRLLVLVTSLLTVFAVAPSVASATLRVANHNDPAGDPAVTTYRITNGPGGTFPENFTFQLGDAADTSFGPRPATYTIQAAPPAGWGVADIQCVGASPAFFQIDIPNGRVTVNHATDQSEDTCSYTNRRLGASGGVSGARGSVVAPGTGVAPNPAADELARVTLPKKAALLRVGSGLRFATARVRLTRASIVRAQLLWRKTKVAGSVRLVRAAGTYEVKVQITKAMRRQMQRAGLERAPLTLKVVVTPRTGGAAQVFRFGVRVLL